RSPARLDRSPAGATRAGAMSTLSIRGLDRSFGGLHAVRELSFETAAKGITALIGPNGAGKTTTFNMISGMIRPGAGSVHLDGREITGYRPERICAAGVGRTFQNLQLFGEMTVLENVMVGAHTHTPGTILGTGLRLARLRRAERAVLAEATALLERFG